MREALFIKFFICIAPFLIKLARLFILNSNVNDLKKSVSDGKTLVANAITDKGVATATDATFETMANNISSSLIGNSQVKIYVNNNFAGDRLNSFTASAAFNGYIYLYCSIDSKGVGAKEYVKVYCNHSRLGILTDYFVSSTSPYTFSRRIDFLPGDTLTWICTHTKSNGEYYSIGGEWCTIVASYV